MPKKSLAKYVSEIRKELLTKRSQRVTPISDCASIQAKPLKMNGKTDATPPGEKKRKRA